MSQPDRRAHLRSTVPAAIGILIGWSVGVLLGVVFWQMTRETAFGIGLGALTVVMIALAAAWWRDRREAG